MARLALLTLLGGHFVDRAIDLATLRRQESEQALASIGVSAAYSNLPDGKLHHPEHRDSLTRHIVASVRDSPVRAIATLGMHGFCGHQDHIAAHQAAVDAQRQLVTEDNMHVPILALNHNHQGSVQVPVDRKTKLAALTLHESQFGFLIASPTLPSSHQHYTPLLEKETYDIVVA